jgi:hypothetical protein
VDGTSVAPAMSVSWRSATRCPTFQARPCSCVSRCLGPGPVVRWPWPHDDSRHGGHRRQGPCVLPSPALSGSGVCGRCRCRQPLSRGFPLAPAHDASPVFNDDVIPGSSNTGPNGPLHVGRSPSGRPPPSWALATGPTGPAVVPFGTVRPGRFGGHCRDRHRSRNSCMRARRQEHP